jgi:hypothetical protein
MTRELFRKRFYRTYFQLLDAFSAPRCALCYLLARSQDELITRWVQARRSDRDAASVESLCALHKAQFKNLAAGDLLWLPHIKALICDALKTVAHA